MFQALPHWLKSFILHQFCCHGYLPFNILALSSCISEGESLTLCTTALRQARLAAYSHKESLELLK